MIDSENSKGGGGGNLGADMRAGPVDLRDDNYDPSPGNESKGVPGNASLSGGAGYGGREHESGIDGKVSVWCTP